MADIFSQRFCDIRERIGKARAGTGFVAWVDLYPIVPLDRPPSASGLRACATHVYRASDPTAEIRGVSPRKPAIGWRAALIEHVSANPFDHLPENRCAEAARLGAQLADLIETELGDIRMAGTVDYRPRDWYAAVWEDWVLVSSGRATVLHLGWDS